MHNGTGYGRGSPPALRDASSGLRANWRQFTLLVVINGFVGAMLGSERTVVPLIAKQNFHVASGLAVLSFLVTFGTVKALANLVAGSLSDRMGRKRVLVAGWLVGLPVPLMIIVAPHWGWVVAANVLLGINQGLCWSSTVIMKMDLAGPRQRGLAMGINECAGYLAVSLSGLAAGYLAGVYGLRPQPFYLGAVCAALGLLLSVVFVRETHPLRGIKPQSMRVKAPSFGKTLLLVSWKDRRLFAVSQAGMVNNLNDGLVWGLIPIFLSGKGLSLAQVALVASVYPGVWGVSQLATGALSDRWGRKWMIVAGMWVQAIGLGVLAWGQSFWGWTAGAVLLGMGTALVYPTLLAAVSDVAHPEWRATAVGVYRLWRDGGYAVGALATGLLADAFGIPLAIAITGALTFLSGVVVAGVMHETLAGAKIGILSGTVE